MNSYFHPKSMTRPALFGLLTLLCGFVRIPVGPVPVTMQTLAVSCAAIFLNPVEATMAMVVHLLLKMLFTGGPALVLMPSFGFLLGFIFSAWAGSLLFRKAPVKNLSLRLVLGLFMASFLPYLFGLPYMAYILNWVQGLSFGGLKILKRGFLVFLPGDLIKFFLAYLITQKAGRRILAGEKFSQTTL